MQYMQRQKTTVASQTRSRRRVLSSSNTIQQFHEYWPMEAAAGSAGFWGDFFGSKCLQLYIIFFFHFFSLSGLWQDQRRGRRASRRWYTGARARRARHEEEADTREKQGCRCLYLCIINIYIWCGGRGVSYGYLIFNHMPWGAESKCITIVVLNSLFLLLTKKNNTVTRPRYI